MNVQRGKKRVPFFLMFRLRALQTAPRWARSNSSTQYVALIYCQTRADCSRTQWSAPSESNPVPQVVPGTGLQLPQLHPRTHDIPVANVHFRSHHVRLLDLFTHFASHAATALGIPTSNVVYLPTQRRLWTVIRSPFAHKKSQENFERKVHKRAIKAWDADPEVVEQWIKYIRLHGMGGVGIKVTRWEHLPIGVGRTMLEGVELELDKTLPAEEIKELGEKILKEEMA